MDQEAEKEKIEIAEQEKKKVLELESNNMEDVELALNLAFNGKDNAEIPDAPRSARVKIEIPDVNSEKSEPGKSPFDLNQNL